MDILQSLYNGGGIITIFIVVGAIFATYLILERFYHFQRARVDVDEFINGIANNLRHDNLVEAIKICDETPGPVPHLVRVAILRADKSELELREALKDVALSEIPRLERNLTLLATVATLTPLMGLLGTVAGMIGAFQALHTVGMNASPSDLAGSIELALYSTAAGLSVSIPANAFYNILVDRVKGLILDMEKTSNQIVYFLMHHDVNLNSISSKSSQSIENN
jgi:biopolymer transport protein ExbB